MDISEDPENAYIIEPLIDLAKTKIPLELYAEKIDIFGRDNVFQRELLRKAPIIRAYDKFPAESLALFDSIYGLVSSIRTSRREWHRIASCDIRNQAALTSFFRKIFLNRHHVARISLEQ